MAVVDPIEILLDKRRALKFDLWAFRQAERELNKSRGGKPVSLAAVIRQELFEGEPSIDLILTLLWASLLHEDPALTVEQVGHFPVTVAALAPKLLQAIQSAFVTPETDDAEEIEEEKKTNPLNGSAFGHLPASPSR